MVNQNPQPEVFETNFTIDVSAVGSNTNTIYTHQGHNEQFMVYAIGVDILNANGIDSSGTYSDFDLTINAGSNSVPSNPFDAGAIAKNTDGIVALTCPIVVQFKQPLQVRIDTITNSAVAGPYTVTVRLIGETSIINT